MIEATIQRASLKSIFREKELWLLVLLGILYFYRPLFLGETFFFRDLCLDILPQKQSLVDFMNTRQLPLWTPYLHGGQPYLADIPFFPLYPSNLLYLFLPFLWTFNLNIILHFIGCAVFAYLFSRIIGLQPLSSFIVGVAYEFCGYTLSLANHGCRLIAMPYLPLLFLFWHLFWLERKKKWFVITVIVGVIQVFAGSIETNIISLGSLLGWTLCYPYPHASLLHKLERWLLLGVFILGVSAIQIIPTVEMVSQSSRGQGLDYAAFSQWSLHFGRILELLFPGFLGHLNTLPWDVYYWGGNLVDGRTPYIRSIYFGGIVIAFAVIGGLRRGDNKVLLFRVRIFLLSLFILSLVLSMGRFFPFFHLLYQYIPLITVFRYPIKFLIAGIFPLALLAGYTADVHFSSNLEPLQWVPSSKLLGMFWGIADILFLLTSLFLFSDDFAYRFQEVFFKRSGGDIMRRGIGASLIHAAGIWLLMTLLYQYRRLKGRQWQSWILVCILLVDLLSAGKQINSYAPREFFTDVPPIVSLVRREIGDGKIFRAKDPAKFTLWIPSYDVMWMYRSDLETLNSYQAAFYRFPVIFHEDFDGLAQVRVIKLNSLIDSLSWERRLPLLSAGGVTLILTSEHISLPGVRLVAEVPNRTNIPFYLYRNETAAARVEFVTNWEVANSDNEAFAAMLRANYDPRNHVVLQEPESSFFEPDRKTTPVNNMNSQPHACASAHLTTIRSDPLSASFSVSNTCDGYLVFAEPFYPGWRVSVDGNLTPIVRANYAFSAVFLSAGEHTVERRYRPNSVRSGILSSLVFCGLLGLVTWKGWRLK